MFKIIIQNFIANLQAMNENLHTELNNVKSSSGLANETAAKLEVELRQQREAKATLQKSTDELLDQINEKDDLLRKKEAIIRVTLEFA